jgi:hypothetical protein
LAVFLLAEDPAVLTGDPDRVASLLRDAGIVHDPRGHGTVALQRFDHPVARDAEHGGGVPGGVRDEVVHRLVARPHVTGVHAGGHRLDALARSGQTEPRQVRTQRLSTIPVAEGTTQTLEIGAKAAVRGGRRMGHASSVPHHPGRCLDFMTR